MTIRNVGTGPIIDEFIEAFAGRAIYSMANLYSRYHQFQLSNESRDIIHGRMVTSIPVSYIEWSTTDQEHQFATVVLKARGMTNTTWAYLAFAHEIEVLSGVKHFIKFLSSNSFIDMLM